jgi:hypothetical protein
VPYVDNDPATIDGAGFILPTSGSTDYVVLSEDGVSGRAIRGEWPHDDFQVSVVDASTLAVFSVESGCGFIDRIKKGVL